MGSSARVLSGHMPSQKPQAQHVTDIFHLFQMPSGFRTGFMQIVERSARKLQLARRFKAYRAVRPGERDDVLALEHRRPAKPRQALEQRLDAARRVGDGRVRAQLEDELLVLRADAPRLLRLRPGGEPADQVLKHERTLRAGDIGQMNLSQPVRRSVRARPRGGDF